MSVLTLGTNKLLSLFDLSERESMWQAWSEDKQAVFFFMQGYVGQQIELKQYSKPYWQPLKGTKQWKDFFKRGETWADLKCEGKEPSVSDKLIIYVILVIKMSMQSFTGLD